MPSRCPCTVRSSKAGILVLSTFAWSILACGGGNGSSGPNTPAADFSISASVASLSLGSGQSQNVTISVGATNSFASAVTVNVSGLPSGVSASPSSFNISPGGQQVVSITVGGTATPGKATLSFQGTAAGLNHSADVSLSVFAIVTGAHPPIRTQFRRTNLFYDSNNLQFAPPHFAVYDRAHKQFFVSNPTMNEIDVFDAVSEGQKAQITVPFAWGLDISPIDGSLYAGTFLGDIYHIDTSKLSRIERYPSASIGPNGFVATTALVLADGRLALQGAPGAILAADGYGPLAIWDPASNSLDTANGALCPGANGAIALSGDRTRILATGVNAGPNTVCSYDTVARVATYGSFPFTTFVRQIIPTPDGTRFFLTSNLEGVGVFDIKTMKMIGQITNPNSNSGNLPNAAVGAVISLDGRTLYLVDELTGAVGAFDTTTLAQTGWVPSIAPYFPEVIVISAMDETGLIAGPTEGFGGVAFLDAANTTTAQPTMLVASDGTATTGPLAGGTVISTFFTANVTDNAVPSVIYVGNQPGSDPSFIARPGFINSAQVTTPESNVEGLVDLTMVLSDGGVGIVPEGFTYGPGLLELIPNAATAEGGQEGALIAVGLGSDPSESHNYQNWLRYKIPPGSAAASVDMTVTTPSGSATLKDGFHYAAPLETYPIAATLQDGIYDAGRDLYYFTDRASIQVLSRVSKTWLTPLSLPGVTSNTQLLAIAESPDGSKLAVSDYGGNAIYVLNPDSPATAKRYSVNGLIPAGLAVTNAGDVYFATGSPPPGTPGTAAFLKLDGSSGTVINLVPDLSNTGTYDGFDRVILSHDGSRVYAGVSIDNMWVDTSTDQVHISKNIETKGLVDMAVSADGSTVYMNGEFADGSLNAEIAPGYIQWESWFRTQALGAKLSPDGSLLFQPLTDGIDIIARNTGRLLYRVQIATTPASNYNCLVSTDNESSFAIIGANSVSFVNFSSLSIPSEYRTPF
jgi:hypothetical protein